jgi:hypothetical protein
VNSRAAWTKRFGQLDSKPSMRVPFPADRMNKTERAFHDQHLKLLVAAGDAIAVGFQRLKLRLADRTWYTPDFDLVLPTREIEIYEVKGFMRDDAAVKLKVAAEIYPFQFYVVRRSQRSWSIVKI